VNLLKAIVDDRAASVVAVEALQRENGRSTQDELIWRCRRSYLGKRRTREVLREVDSWRLDEVYAFALRVRATTVAKVLRRVQERQ
jgi:hypothetical protein